MRIAVGEAICTIQHRPDERMEGRHEGEGVEFTFTEFLLLDLS